MSTKRSIILKGCPEVTEEGTATEVIKPGYLVKGVSSVAKQTGTHWTPRTFALERDELGQGIDNSKQGVGTNSAYYAVGDRVKVAAFDGGDEVTAYVASGEDISEDDLLGSAGDGTLTEVADTAEPMFQAMETLGAVVVETAVRVRVL